MLFSTCPPEITDIDVLVSERPWSSSFVAHIMASQQALFGIQGCKQTATFIFPGITRFPHLNLLSSAFLLVAASGRLRALVRTKYSSMCVLAMATCELATGVWGILTFQKQVFSGSQKRQKQGYTHQHRSQQL